GVWRFPPPLAALLVFVACSCQIQHDLSYRFSIASLCFMCICVERMTTPPLFFASYTLPYGHNNHHHRSLADRR
uniref:Secreted protein n=1 Tax=Triticum urartu TaxID=4572 RepID=A0A8R7P2Q4_TRIUA